MTILINADGCPGVSDVMKNKTSSRTLPLIRLNLRLWRRWWAFEPTFQNAEKSAFWRESGEILRPLERTGERDSGSHDPSIQYVASDADKIKAAKDG